MPSDPTMQLASRLYGQPLAVHPDALRFFRWARIELDELRAWMNTEAQSNSEPVRVDKPGTVALIPVRGSLFRSTMLSDYDAIGEMFQDAIDDPNVSAIVLDVDSPGGEVAGMLGLANQIHASRGEKPIVAVANDQATSAAYAIASSADKVFVSPTATVGSIGVVALHADESGANEKAGFQITEVASGSQKTALSPNRALSDIGRGLLEKIVNSAAGEFFDLVARNRGISRDQVEAQQAGVFFGAEAIDAGLADGVRSRADVIAELAGPAGKTYESPASAPALAADASAEPAEASQHNPNHAEGPNMPESEETTVEVEETATEEIAATAEPSVEAETEEIVDLEAVRQEGRAAANADAREIVELCTIAGRAAEAAGFIAASASVEDVRTKLLETTVEAAGAEITNQVDAMKSSATSPRVDIDSAAIYKARRELGGR